MKHFTQTTANGLHTPPCGSSHGKLSSFRFRNSLLMLFLLLFVGTNAAWAGWRFQGQDGSSDDWGRGDNMTQVGSSDIWYYKISNLNADIQFKINNGNWDGEKQKYWSANHDDQNRGNVQLEDANDGDKDGKNRFKYSRSTNFNSNVARDLYIFVKGDANNPQASDKVWAIAVTPGSGAISKAYSLRGDLWLNSEGGWASKNDQRNPVFVNMTNDVAAQLSYLIPIPSGSYAMKSRFTLISGTSPTNENKLETSTSTSSLGNGNYSSDAESGGKYKLTIPANGGSYPTVKRIVLDYYATGKLRARLEDYIVKRDGWHLYVDDKYMGAMSNSGSFTIESMAPGTHTMYIANYSHGSINNSTYNPYSDGGGKIHAQQWFGGLYIDVNPAHSNVTFENKTAYYNSGNDYFGSQTYPIAGTKNARGQFKINETSNVKFTFDGGVITINTLDGTEPAEITYTGKEYVFLSKTQKHTDNNVFNFTADGAHLFVYFWNSETSANGWSDEAFMWDSGDNVLAAKAPAGTWTNCIIVRKNSNDNAKNMNNVWNQTADLALEEGKNYLQTGESSVWGVYTPPFYLTGSSVLCGADWGYTGNGIVNNGTVTRENIPAGTYQFKLNPTKNYNGWEHQINYTHVASTGSNVTLSSPSDNQIQFTLSEASDVTIAYDGNGVTVNATPYAPPAVTRTVTIHPNGGTAVSPLSVGEGQTISSISSTYGNGTAKWYKDEELTQEFILGTSTVTSDMDLYAKWGVSGNFYIGGDMWMHEKNGNNWAYYSTMAMTTTDGVASVTYIAPKGRNRFEILTTRSNWATIPNQDSGLIASSTPTLNWAQYGPDNYYHFVFDLDAPKKVTIRYNGKVSVTAEDYDVVKTGWTVVSPTLFGHGSDDNADYAENNTFMSGYNMTEGQMDANGERTFLNVAPGTYKFWIGKYNTNLDKTKQQIEVFGAANVDIANSSLTGYGSLADVNNAHINRNIPQDDKLHRRVQFTLTQTASIKIAFDGGKITVNLLPKYTVTFNSNDGSAVASQSVFEGTTATEPSAPTKDGYTFVKWQLNGVDYNFSSAVNGDITLDAVWAAKTLESISLDESSIVMVMGGSNATLTPSYLPTDLIAGQQPTYDWSVSPSGVVTVDGGVITAVAEGTATVTCTAHGTDKSANCVVTVKDCNTVPTDIFAYTLGSDPTGDAAGSAAMNGMFDEADNTEPAELTKLQIKFGDNSHITGAYVAYVVDKNTEYVNFAASNTTDNSYWYKTYQTESDANNQIFTLKNAATGNYLALSNNLADNSNGNWIRYFATTTTTINNASKWKQGTSNAYRLYNQSNTNLFLHIYNVAGDTRNDGKVVVGGEDGSQGNNQLKFTFENVNEHASNPAYMHSPVSGYYRFATGASVVVTLNRAIKVNDVIRLEVKNPSDAAVLATVTIGSQVENINLAAGATSTETITVTDGSRPTSITIASDNVNFMLKSVAVNREMPNPAKNPNLAWSATPSAAHQVADGDISSYIATRSGAGIITYTSSDESIATVAADGTVHPIAEGTVTITATLEQDGCYDGGSINYSLTLEDLPKPTITITANDEMPQGSYQTVTVSQNGDGALTFEITSGTGATLTDNGDGTYRLALAGNATDIVLTASTERTEQKAQHSVSKNISVQQCYVDGHVIYEYELTGHADATDVVATGGTYSQANLASVGTTDNPTSVTIVKLKFRNESDGRIFAVDNAGTVNVENDGSPDKAQWLLIPAGENIHPTWANSNCAVYYLKNKATGKYLYRSESATSGDWGYATIGTSTTNASTDYYKWFFYNNGKEHIFAKVGIANDLAHSFRLNSSNQFNTCYSSDKTLLFCGSMTDDNAFSGIYTDQGEMNVGSATNPDYFYSVTHDAHEYYILNGGSVTVSRASAFKVGDVITLNVFNRGAAASSTIKVAENTIADNVNGAAALTYTVVAEDGIEGLNSFVITPLNEYICLNSISIFRPKDEDEFVNPVLSWDANLSTQQIIDRNASESSMQHAASFVAPVNASVVYSVAPAAKATVNEEGLVTLTGEALNKDVLTVTATLPAIGCYNQAQAAYEIYVKNLATPTLSAVFGTLQQGYASTLTVTTNSDAVPALSNINGFAVNGDPSHEGDNYIYNIVVNNTVESASVHVALSQTSDYLAAATDAVGSVNTSSLEDLYENTPEGGTLVLDADYNENIVINKAITINGGGHSIGNLKVENEGDLTLSSALTVADFTICAKAGNTTTPAASGQVRNASNLTVDGEAYFLYTVDPSGQVQYGWYDFTVPFPVNVMTGIKGIQEGVLKENFVNETDYAIMEHLGDKQAAGQYAYKKFRGIMQPNKLYSITLDDDYNYNTIRFQKTSDGALVASNEVTLNTYASTVDGKHANWNGVGNGTLHHADAGLSVATIQVYQSGEKTFLPVNKNQYSLVIGSAFMVQQTGTMTLSQASHDKLLAPRRDASAQATAIQIAREGKPFSDQLYITADELAGQGYTQGVDVAKAGNIGNVNVPQIWTNAYNSKLCAHEAQLIDGEAQYTLSLYAPANGTYTLTSKNIPEGYTLYLTQNGNKLWDMSDTYVLDLTKGTTTEYGLLLVENYKMPTAVDNIFSNTDETTKIMRNGILYILQNGKVFNAQGARVK